MDGHFYALLARMRYIQRWALMRNTEPENIQEHSHMVAILAHALALIQNKHFGGHIDPGQAALLALYHDATEILTGDLPTPIKYYNPAPPIKRWKRQRPTGCWSCCRRNCGQTTHPTCSTPTQSWRRW